MDVLLLVLAETLTVVAIVAVCDIVEMVVAEIVFTFTGEVEDASALGVVVLFVFSLVPTVVVDGDAAELPCAFVNRQTTDKNRMKAMKERYIY